MHRADAELALGRGYELSAELAADGLTEWLERVVVQGSDGRIPLLDGQSLHLHATDGGEWTLRGSGGALALDQSHGDASATVSAEATPLFLAVVRRIPADDPRITISGDGGVWHAWLDQTPF